MSRYILVIAGGLFATILCLPSGDIRADSCGHDNAAVGTVEAAKIYRCPAISADKKPPLSLAEDQSFMGSAIMKEYIDVCGADMDALKSMTDAELAQRYIMYAARKECFE